ncbi:hypothetical protein PF005_g1828 [Phytophthora fragariae]|uniref:Secreted protein n=1 Tax=Phytophthora fragariae TaxID=53985 RepID=A0A6A3FTN1_9STRA|nr:hypothetical protein PF003_g29224 [Phytophthora fragariae]KAE8947450.1 hypothetical protein PF009_g2926 [Phytophthora fragariae]KAE9153620.1 hypothetical protein PF006_g2246 [Phytophthora fragariae]KAE9234546.1 hypothetical protein PF005_g1828 [Phytophthora fragariae]KAE9252073.1 hypothetical protein PF004_g2175 [Phytophthora fragariae]
MPWFNPPKLGVVCPHLATWVVLVSKLKGCFVTSAEAIARVAVRKVFDQPCNGASLGITAPHRRTMCWGVR